MFEYNPFDYVEFAKIINSCLVRAHAITDAKEDKGYANNDMIALTFLTTNDVTKFTDQGLRMERRSGKGISNQFWLMEQNGQAERNTEFCRQLSEMLRQAGILSTIVYQAD